MTGIDVTPLFFSFDLNGGSSSLDVAFSNADGYEQYATGKPIIFASPDLPVVTMVSSITTTATPEPGALLPVSVGLVAGFLTVRAHRNRQADCKRVSESPLIRSPGRHMEGRLVP